MTADRLSGHFARSYGQISDGTTPDLPNDCVIEVFNTVEPQNNPTYLHEYYTIDTPTMPFVVRKVVLYSGLWRIFQSAQYAGAFIDIAVPNNVEKVEINDILTYPAFVAASMTAVGSIKLLFCSNHAQPPNDAPLILYSGGTKLPGGSWQLTSRKAKINPDTLILSCECKKLDSTWIGASLNLSDNWDGTVSNVDGVLVKDANTNNGNTGPFKSTPTKPSPIYLFDSHPDLGQLSFDNFTRSVHVKKYKWRFFRKPNYVGQYFDLTIGQYNVGPLMADVWGDDLTDTISSVLKLEDDGVVTPPESQNANGIEWHESTNFLLPDGTYRNIKDLRQGDLLRCISPGRLLCGKFKYSDIFPQGSNNTYFTTGGQNITPVLGVVRIKSIGIVKTVDPVLQENGYYYFKVQNNPSGVDDITFESTNITIPLAIKGTMPKKEYEFDGKPETHMLMDVANTFSQGYVLMHPGISEQNFAGNKWFRNGEALPKNLSRYRPVKHNGSNNFFLDVGLRTYGNNVAYAGGNVYNLEIEPVDGNSCALIVANGYYVTNLNFTTQSTTPIPAPPSNPPSGGGGGGGGGSDPNPNANAQSQSLGCFSPDTLVLMSDNSKVPIGSVQVGDKVRSMRIPGLPISDDFNTYKSWWSEKPIMNGFDATVTSVQAGNFSWYVELFFKDKLQEQTLPPLKATPEHPLLIRRENIWRFMEAVNVRAGDYLFDYVRGPVLVINVGRQHAPGLYYNLGVDGCNLFIAGGFIVHNADVDNTARSAAKQYLNSLTDPIAPLSDFDNFGFGITEV